MPEKRDWRKFNDLTTGRVGAGACVLGAYLYVFGGMSQDGSLLTSIEKLSTDLDMWSFLKVILPVPLYDFQLSVSKNEKVYILGGQTDRSNG